MPLRLVLAAAAALAGCMGGDGAAADERPRDVGAAGVTVALPDRWRELEIDDGNVIDPVTRVAIASGARRAPLAGCETQITRYAPRPDGAAVVVVEWKRTDDADPPPRPRSLAGALTLRRGGLECFAADGGSVQFVERERVIGVYAMVGARANTEIVEKLRRAVDALRVTAGREPNA